MSVGLKHKLEIHKCQMERAGDDAWSRSQARSKAAREAAAGATTSGTAEKAANAKLQQDTAAKFKAIQAQAGAWLRN